MKRSVRWIETRLSILPVLEAFRASQPPDRISLRAAPPFSLGRIAVLLIVILVLSGFGLLLFYEPTAEGAAASLARLHDERPAGWLIHNAHRWSALLLVVTLALHALRAWIVRAYRAPRDLNWWLGILLLLTVILMGATGYLLRWDIKAFALMDLIVSNFSDIPFLGRAFVVAMLGEGELERVPLYRGYAFHVWIIPIFLGLTLTLHLLVAWRQGLAETPTWWRKWRGRHPNIRWPHLLPGLVLLTLVIALSLLTPHESQSGPSDTSLWPHPDWILMFYLLPFWVFDQSSRVIGAVVIPGLLLVLLIIAPLLGGRISNRWGLAALSALGIGGVIWLFGQTAYMGTQVPMQGCAACHRSGILGGAPTTLSEFRIRDPDWLIAHLLEPETSILTPYERFEGLP